MQHVFLMYDFQSVCSDDLPDLNRLLTPITPNQAVAEANKQAQEAAVAQLLKKRGNFFTGV